MTKGDKVRTCGLLAGLVFIAGPATPQATVKSESVQVHSKMDETSDVVMTLKKGDAVVIEMSILGKGNVEWCSIQETTRKQSSGYIRCDFLARSAAPKVAAAPVQSTVPGAGQQAASQGYWEPGHKETFGEARYLAYARILATNFGFSQDQKDQSLRIADRIGLLACIEDSDSYARQGLTPPDLIRTPRSHQTTQCDWTFQSFIEQVFALVTPEQQASDRATYARLAGVKDPEVLRIAADSGRILVSQDRRTMPVHFARHVRNARSPGVVLVREATPIAIAIEELVLIWAASEAEEWTNRVVWIPL